MYGPQDREDKLLFLQELQDIRAQCQGPWVVFGDSNLIYREEDKNNPNINRAMMGRFRRCIGYTALKEIPLVGHKYTWSNERDNPTLVKLDRVFCSADWEDMFPRCLLQGAATEGSDHCPLLLGLNDLGLGKKRFHFETFWPSIEGFSEVVSTAWSSVQSTLCPLETLSLKFRAVSRALQSWSQK